MVEKFVKTKFEIFCRIRWTVCFSQKNEINITRLYQFWNLSSWKFVKLKFRIRCRIPWTANTFHEKKIRWILPESSDELLYRFWKLSDREEEEEKHQWLPHKGTFWSYFVWWFLFVFFASYPDELKAFVLWLSLFSYLTQKFSLFMSRKYWILGLHMKRRLVH